MQLKHITSLKTEMPTKLARTPLERDARFKGVMIFGRI